jgi:hypothetical protein
LHIDPASGVMPPPTVNRSSGGIGGIASGSPAIFVIAALALTNPLTPPTVCSVLVASLNV